MWLFALVELPWQDLDYDQEEKGWVAAEKAIKNPRAFEVDDFRWSASKTLSLLRVGQRVVQCTKTDSGNVFVSPPSRIINIHRYSAKKQKRAIIYLETPRKQRRRQLPVVLRNLGSIAERLGNPRRTKQLRDPELIYELGRLWS
jgi:hypothetical protein